jgi:putative tricarboxylic transport membrane protein
MALDRWIALVLLGVCLIYGYTAWFTMDDSLAPFMRRNPIWPSTFPKVLSVLGGIAALVILLGLEGPQKPPKEGDIDYRRLGDYKVGQAIALLLLMVAYALFLRPAGFLLSTTSFLVLGSVILGERNWVMMIGIAVVAAGAIWYLVQEVLGIFLRPLPMFMGI